MVKKIFTFNLLLACTFAFGQPAEYKMTREEYTEKYKDDAVKEMLAHGVPASITLAQGMIESSNGNSALAVYANNHFGIKCHDDWTGMTYYQDDDEVNECFRKYNSVLESYSDHSLFLMGRDRYAFLFQLKTTDYKGWAQGLADAGYATDPNYAAKLIDIIKQFRLYELDRMVMMPLKPPVIGSRDKQPKLSNNAAPKILLNNNVKCIIAKPGDTYFGLAKKLDMGLRQLYRYNETGKNAVLKAGDIVYLQRKRKRSGQEFYTVKKGETMYSVSQQFGIRLKSLYRKNRMKPGEEPAEGITLYLKKRKKR